jgi:hypothetical protein
VSRRFDLPDDGQITRHPQNPVHPLRDKNFACAVGQIRGTESSRPAPLRRGVRAIATDVGCGMQWTRWCRKASDASADGKIVWSRHPDAGVKFSREAIPVGATVAIKPGTPGRARYKP